MPKQTRAERLRKKIALEEQKRSRLTPLLSQSRGKRATEFERSLEGLSEEEQQQAIAIQQGRSPRAKALTAAKLTTTKPTAKELSARRIDLQQRLPGDPLLGKQPFEGSALARADSLALSFDVSRKSRDKVISLSERADVLGKRKAGLETKLAIDQAKLTPEKRGLFGKVKQEAGKLEPGVTSKRLSTTSRQLEAVAAQEEAASLLWPGATPVEQTRKYGALVREGINPRLAIETMGNLTGEQHINSLKAHKLLSNIETFSDINPSNQSKVIKALKAVGYTEGELNSEQEVNDALFNVGNQYRRMVTDGVIN